MTLPTSKLTSPEGGQFTRLVGRAEHLAHRGDPSKDDGKWALALPRGTHDLGATRLD